MHAASSWDFEATSAVTPALRMQAVVWAALILPNCSHCAGGHSKYGRQAASTLRGEVPDLPPEVKPGPASSNGPDPCWLVLDAYSAPAMLRLHLWSQAAPVQRRDARAGHACAGQGGQPFARACPGLLQGLELLSQSLGHSPGQALSHALLLRPLQDLERHAQR